MPWRILSGYRPAQSRQVIAPPSPTGLHHPLRNCATVQKTMDPTIARLIIGNSHWAKAVDHAQPRFFQGTAKGQAPKVLWIGCSDSRVPESVVTASKPGDIFVHRNIANQFRLDDDSALSVLTYAIDQLGVEHVVVVGHTQCGGAAACYNAALEAAADRRRNTSGSPCSSPSLSPGPTPAPDTPLGRWLAPLTAMATQLGAGTAKHERDHEHALSALVQANIAKQVENLCMASPVRNVWEGDPRERKVWVHGLLYEVESGTLRDLGVTRGPPHERQ